MIKYTNPFYTINAAATILRHLGADPNKLQAQAQAQNPSGATYTFPWGGSVGAKPEESIYWQDHILGIMVQRVYEKDTHYYKIEIHLDAEGFDSVYSLVKASNIADEVPPLLKKKHSDDYDMHYIEPGDLLTLFKLVVREDEQ